jgi:hypothetical protein
MCDLSDHHGHDGHPAVPPRQFNGRRSIARSRASGLASYRLVRPRASALP